MLASRLIRSALMELVARGRDATHVQIPAEDALEGCLLCRAQPALLRGQGREERHGLATPCNHNPLSSLNSLYILGQVLIDLPEADALLLDCLHKAIVARPTSPLSGLTPPPPFVAADSLLTRCYHVLT